MNTIKQILNQVKCLCAAEPAPAMISPSAGSLWQWYRDRNGEWAARGKEMPPVEQPVKRLRAHF